MIVAALAATYLTGCGGSSAATPPPSTPATAPPRGSATTSDCPLVAAPANRMSAPPAGLIAFKIYQPGEAPFPSEVFADPSVSGVDIFMQWSQLEPESGVFNWSVLDCVFAQADDHNKFVALTLSPGFTTPAWVLELPGVQTQSFAFEYFNNNAPARPLPLPWNQPYLQAWFTSLKAVAERYGTNPEFRLIAVGGPTSVSTEMSLPDRTSGDTALPASANGSDIAEWQTLGYTPSRYASAWKEAFSNYRQIFPNQFLGLALYPGLPIGENEQPDPSQKIATELDVIAAGLQYKEVFALGEAGIRGGVPPPSDPAYNAVMAKCGSIVTGFQNSRSATVDPTDQGPLNLALGHVAAAGASFWEVYVQDVLNPSMQSATTTAAAQLPADKGCKPLVVTIASRTATSVTVTAVTDLRLDPAESINIYLGTTLLRTCSTSTCSVSVPLSSSSPIYAADVGAPGTAPDNTQALVSATTTVTP